MRTALRPGLIIMWKMFLMGLCCDGTMLFQRRTTKSTSSTSPCALLFHSGYITTQNNPEKYITSLLRSMLHFITSFKIKKESVTKMKRLSHWESLMVLTLLSTIYEHKPHVISYRKINVKFKHVRHVRWHYLPFVKRWSNVPCDKRGMKENNLSLTFGGYNYHPDTAT